eukprot:1878267-Ditylum_brightwellii.AAC.1
MQWEKPKCIGDIPHKRSGHSFTEVGSFALMFGGCVEPSGSEVLPAPTNELYKLDIGGDGSAEMYWTKVKPSSQPPPPRWRHSANKMADNRIVVFGGFSPSKDQPRLNDVWVFDTENENWTQPCNTS